MKRLTLNTLLSLIIQSKITGRGMLGNGKLYVKLIKIILDNDSAELSEERNILNKFNNELVEKEAYRKLERFISRFLKNGKGYPYEIISLNEFENSIGNAGKIVGYLRKMRSFCDEVINVEKLDSLVYTLLKILRQDSSIGNILYGSEFIAKEKLFGSYANPKRICIESLLLGLLYHVHKNPAETEKIELLDIPARRNIQTVRFGDENCLDTELPIDFLENIHETAKRQKSADMKYKIQMWFENKDLDELPDSGNLFIYGTGGVGKSTILLNLVGNNNTINFYLPLYQYRKEIHERLRFESCWILLQILLKYHYQYEYLTYENCALCEGEDIVMRQITMLNRKLKSDPDKWQPEYVLLLDGLNEVPVEFQKDIISELTWICREWKNVRIIISGRIIPQYDLFKEFMQVELCGIYEAELCDILSKNDNSDKIINDKRLMEILRIPLFLNIFLENYDSEKRLNNRGEILDSYIMNWKCSLPEDDTAKFIVQFALPLACKEYSGSLFTRANLLNAVDKAIELYISDENVYQDMVAPRKINKKTLLKSREKSDFIELIINNISFVEEQYSKPHQLHFTHQYFENYFGAKHILNAIEALNVVFSKMTADEIEERISDLRIGGIWFNNIMGFPQFADEYRLLGEISGDYKNAPCENFEYHSTLLDEFLKMGRSVFIPGAFDNIVRTMFFSRNKIICGVDFSRISTSDIFPTYVKFSLNGEDPCYFCDSHIWNIPLLHFEDNYSYLTFEDKMIIFFDYWGIMAIWDMKENKLIKDYNIFEEMSDAQICNFMEISEDEKYISLLSTLLVNKFDIESGKFVGEFFWTDKEFKDLKKKFKEAKGSIKELDRDFLTEVISQIGIFKGCDFDGAIFMDKYEKEMLSKVGALCNFEENNFVSEDTKKIQEGWIDFFSSFGLMY